METCGDRPKNRANDRLETFLVEWKPRPFDVGPLREESLKPS